MKFFRPAVFSALLLMFFTDGPLEAQVKANNEIINLEPEFYSKTVIMQDLEEGLAEIIEFIQENLN